jgi:hypothetical protein
MPQSGEPTMVPDESSADVRRKSLEEHVKCLADAAPPLTRAQPARRAGLPSPGAADVARQAGKRAAPMTVEEWLEKQLAARPPLTQHQITQLRAIFSAPRRTAASEEDGNGCDPGGR